jgi:hypothetical protein
MLVDGEIFDSSGQLLNFAVFLVLDVVPDLD